MCLSNMFCRRRKIRCASTSWFRCVADGDKQRYRSPTMAGAPIKYSNRKKHDLDHFLEQDALNFLPLEWEEEREKVEDDASAVICQRMYFQASYGGSYKADILPEITVKLLFSIKL